MDKKTQSPLDKVLPNLNRNPYLGKDNEFDDWNVELQTRSLAENNIGPDDRIVLCVGDSFTFGDGVYYKNTWTNHLQEGVFKDYKVINVGICGASNTLITNTLSKWCNLYSKQIKCVIIGLSFSQRRTYFSAVNNFALESSVVNLSPGNDWNPQKLDIIKKVNKATNALHTSENDQSDLERNLLLVKGLGKMSGFKTYWWAVDDLGDKKYITNETNCLLLEDTDFVYMNVTSLVDSICEKEFEEDVDWWHPSSPLRISEDNGHWSIKGHEILAKGLRKFIKENQKITWMFGTTSTFSREIISQLDNPILFGRGNTNYADPVTFIEQNLVEKYSNRRLDNDTILNIIVNVNVMTNYQTMDILESPVKFKDFFMSISDNLFFFFKLLSELNRLEIPVRVCYVTSTFGNTAKYENKSHLPTRGNNNKIIATSKYSTSSVFKYATVRLAQQQTYMSNISPTCRVLGVNPAGLNEDNMKDYAKKIVEMTYADFDDEQWNRVFCLQNDDWYGQGMGNKMMDDDPNKDNYQAP